MRLATLVIDNKPTLCARRDEQYYPVAALAPDAPANLVEFFAAGASVRRALEAALAASTSAGIDCREARYLPPELNPGKIVCLGLNYKDHATESGFSPPDYPTIFLRAGSSLVAHGAPLVRPAASEEFDYEVELAVIIGKRARHASVADALSFVGGYSVFNDATLRDYQFKTGQWTVGKNFDGTGGFGPEVVTPDVLPLGAKGLRISARLNGETVQSANTSDMIFDVASTIAIVSECMTLDPGDVILMGTPSGVGFARKPQLWMRPGDTCECEIETLGVLRNPVAQETQQAAAA
jgi:2-keto-4-pentenoate hydratase/2-oxohepta-3-ene-1,7-dioic acid hydratase in catechol pathway